MDAELLLLFSLNTHMAERLAPHIDIDGSLIQDCIAYILFLYLSIRLA